MISRVRGRLTDVSDSSVTIEVASESSQKQEHLIIVVS